VGCIYEDKKGNIWFGTRLGLSCYDPNIKGNLVYSPFRNFTMEDGLIDNDINSIREDDNGKLWIAARGNACIYDPIHSTFTEIKTKKGMAFTNVRCLIKDKKGNIWLGGNDGLWRYDGTDFTNFAYNFTGHIYEDSKQNIWFLQSESSNIYQMSLYRYDKDNIIPGLENATKIITEQGQIFGLTEDSDGNIWFGTERGACCYNPRLPKGVGEGKAFNYFKE